MHNYTLRNIPQTLYEALRRRANVHRRSLNQEMIAILEQEVGAQSGLAERETWLEQSATLAKSMRGGFAPQERRRILRDAQ